MNLSGNDYLKLYKLQDKFFDWWISLDLPFYLTGGTALGRFYLNHRNSEDLDFFVNAHPQYHKFIDDIKRKIVKKFDVNIEQAVFTDEFTRFFISEDELNLKIDLVNDIDYRTGDTIQTTFGPVDTPANILSNKITAIIGRDEPKDVFDIVHIATHYSFNWPNIFNEAKKKSVVNEIDVEQRLYQFPVEWLESVDWLSGPLDYSTFKSNLLKISDDFLLGKDNSLGSGKISIMDARPCF